MGAEGRHHVPRYPQGWVQPLCATEAHLPPRTTQILWWGQKLVLFFLLATKPKEIVVYTKLKIALNHLFF